MPTVFVRRSIIAMLLVGSCVACFGRLVLHPFDSLVGPQREGANDLTDYFDPLRAFQASSWQRDGRLPTWDPHLQLGRPIIGNPQSGLYYPPNWLPLTTGIGRMGSWLLVLHHLFAGWGMYLLCRRFHFVWPAALLGGVCYLMAPFLIAQTAEGHLAQSFTAAWIPWALFCYERLRRKRRGATPMLAIVLALAFFCGHVQEVYYLVIVLSLLVVTDLGLHLWAKINKNRIESSWLPSTDELMPPTELAMRWVALGVITAGLVAIEFAPVWITAKQTTRMNVPSTSAEGSFGHSRPIHLLQLADPFALGHPENYASHESYYWESLMYVGVIPLALALSAIVLGRGTYPIGRFSILLVGLLLFSLGDATPLYPTLSRILPGLSVFRIPSRAMFLAAAAVSVLAAGGLHQITARLGSAPLADKRRSWLIGYSAVLAAMLALFVFSLFLPTELPTADNIGWATLNKSWLIGWATAFVAALFIMYLQPEQRTRLSLIFVAMLSAELAWNAWSVTSTVPAAGLRKQSPITRLLSDSAGRHRVLVDHKLLTDYEARKHHIAKVRGYDPFLLVRYAALLQASLGNRNFLPSEAAGYTTHPGLDYAQPMLDLLGVRYLIVAHHEPIRNPNWHLRESGTVPQAVTLRGQQASQIPYAIYENNTYMPRTFVLGKTEKPLGGPAVLSQLREMNPREQLLVADDSLPAGVRQKFAPAKIIEYTPGLVKVEANLQAPGYLVLSDLHFFDFNGANLGWQATLDGQPASIQPVNVGLRGLALSAGKHQVEFRFTPPIWKYGAMVSFLALAGCLGWLGIEFFRTRRTD